MPCTYTDIADSVENTDYKKLKVELDTLTNLLCTLCRSLEVNEQLDVLDLETLRWYCKHKIIDSER